MASTSLMYRFVHSAIRAAHLLILVLVLVATKEPGAGLTITNLSRTTGAVGATVTITGTNFGSKQGSSTVTAQGNARRIVPVLLNADGRKCV